MIDLAVASFQLGQVLEKNVKNADVTRVGYSSFCHIRKLNVCVELAPGLGVYSKIQLLDEWKICY